MPTLNNLAERAGTGDEEVPPGDFAVDTAVWPDPTVTGRYHANLSEAWKVFYAFGGCSMAVALRAAQHAVGRPDLTPRLASAVFAAPVKCGPLVVDTEVLRVGRAVAQATAKLRSAGAATGSTDMHLTAVFGRELESSATFVDTEWPADALSVADSIVPMPPAFNYAQQVECRIGMPGFDSPTGTPGVPVRHGRSHGTVW